VQASLAFAERSLDALERGKAPLEQKQEEKYQHFAMLKQKRDNLKHYITTYTPDVATGPATGTEAAVAMYNAVQRDLEALSKDGQSLTKDPHYLALLEVRPSRQSSA
jgi:hypothetical protein